MTLDTARLQRALATPDRFRFHHFEATDSTNERALAFLKSRAPEAGEPIEVFVAEEQTAGRGRLGRRWISPPGDNLLFSIVHRHRLPPSSIGRLTCAAALAVCDALAVVGASGARIKWPNDVLIDDQKVCGILLEGVARSENGIVVVGIGINVHSCPGANEIEGGGAPATCIDAVCGGRGEREVILAAVLQQWCAIVPLAESHHHDVLMQRYLELAAWIGAKVEITAPGSTMHGILAGFAPNGAVQIRASDGILTQCESGTLKRTAE